LAALDEADMQAMADTITGSSRAFPDYLEAALERRARAAGHELRGLDEAMRRAARMPPFDDAAPAIEMLAAAGLSVGVLTNSARRAAESALSGAGLLDRLELVVGADEAGAYKPDARVYRKGVERTGVEAGAVCLVAAHGWDVLGAARARLRTGWVARKEVELLATVPAPDFRGATLGAVAEQIVRAIR
ncbi:MAG: HAD-IA family hydrolase, partial [Thermoleophilaceae bacterium]